MATERAGRPCSNEHCHARALDACDEMCHSCRVRENARVRKRRQRARDSKVGDDINGPAPQLPEAPVRRRVTGGALVRVCCDLRLLFVVVD